MAYSIGDDGYITNEDNSKRYYFKGLSPLRDRIYQQVLNVPIVNTTAQNTVLFRFSGQQEDISFNFVITNNGIDMSNGTNSPTDITTIQEQIDFLKEEIFQEDFDINWTWYHPILYPSGINVVITDLDIEFEAGSEYMVPASITLKVGNIGAL